MSDPLNITAWCKGEIRLLTSASHIIDQGKVEITVVNQSVEIWNAEGEHPVNVSYHWLGEYSQVVIRDGLRTPLPSAVRPGEAITVNMEFSVPITPGEYTLMVTLVREGRFWFEESADFKTALVKVKVGNPYEYNEEGFNQLQKHCVKRSPFDRNRPLSFMHIPKTAGVSVRTLLQRTLEKEFFDPWFLGSVNSYSHDFYPKFLNKGNYFGHLAYSNLSKYSPNAQFITVLREANCRILSNWLYWRTMFDPNSKPRDRVEILIRRAMGQLIDVLTEPELAPHIDNHSLRMLVWPHPKIPDVGFIDSRHDQELLEEAYKRLQLFSFVDYVENPQFKQNLGEWLGSEKNLDRENVTPSTMEHLRKPLYKEFTPETLDALESRSRLDRQLWCAVVSARSPNADVDKIMRKTLVRSMARFGAIMSPSGAGEWAGWVTKLPIMFFPLDTRLNWLAHAVVRSLSEFCTGKKREKGTGANGGKIKQKNTATTGTQG